MSLRRRLGAEDWRNRLASSRRRSSLRDDYQSDTLPCLFLEIDAHRLTFDQTSIGTPAEVDLGRLLDFFNALGMAVQQNIIDLQDLRRTTIGYAALVTWRDPGVEWFLAHVDAQDAAESTGTEAFAYFRRLGRALEATA